VVAKGREMQDNQVRHRETTGAIIIDTLGRYLFQLRDNVVGITNPGKIGLFGGHREDNETFLECIVREIHEEIGILSHRTVLSILEDWRVRTSTARAARSTDIFSSYAIFQWMRWLSPKDLCLL
jgi:8-oxo-dGTP pyrophosphatase MutT (NUDIX family)